MYIELNVQFQVGRWSIEFGNKHDRMRVILWKHHYADVGSGSFARWQWDFRKRPVVMQESEAPVLEFVGASVVPMQIVKDTNDTWPDVVG